MSAAEPLLRVEDLRVEFPTEDGVVHAVDGISYEVASASTLGIVGESGSGKTVSSLTTLGLTRTQGARITGRILFEGRDLLRLSEEELREIRGNEIAMIFQDPLSALHPFYRVGAQLIEAVRAHQDVSKARARARAVELLDLVGIPDPGKRVDEYPHEFSGGMRQRAMIAMALTNDPKLLIADEPTTALDVTVQAQILALMERLQRELGTAIVIITHDLGVVAPDAHGQPRGQPRADPGRPAEPHQSSFRVPLSPPLPLCATRSRPHRSAVAAGARRRLPPGCVPAGVRRPSPAVGAAARRGDARAGAGA
jgi:peptide/nickel transport system ATP-binding protein